MLPLSAQTSEFLVAYLNERIRHLHHSINLRESDGTKALACFIERYVDLVPDFIGAFEDFLSSAHITGAIVQQVVTAKEFIDTPIEIVSSEEGLEAHMYQAYLAHRLLEELNDLLSSSYDCSVIPVDMTRSNLIVHHIIGEPFANQIDGAIQLLSDKLVGAIKDDESLQEKLREFSRKRSNDPATRYPCLMESSNIRLLFKSQNTRVRLH
ncbi:MAG: hypothetical protein HN817_06715 [Porticoccaceae bacterium]|jgi:hypothetical protein|nr:hypothetical protein [Porticoccaceae bacterium]MBT7375605.1 hypothetical protein [Porticoccaceae bacterium]